MKNLLILSTSALCVLFAVAVPLPAETDHNVRLVQIPLAGNKELDILSLPENADGKLTERNKRTIGVLRQLFPELSKMTNENGEKIDLTVLSERLESMNRVVRQTKQSSTTATSDSADANTIATAISSKEDTNAAASDNNEAKSPAIDELTLDDDETVKDDDRNKRFLNFGFGASSGPNGGSGGSGNFLFDIIRRSFDRVARAAGTIYRVAAGTESVDLQITKQAIPSTDDTDNDHNDDNDSTSRKISRGLNDNGLVGGSAGSEQTDERENAPEGEVGVTAPKSADGYTEGIPGPVTRLFVLANRGIANLVQDLILRIAQTSERVVNFKARLITSLI